MSTITWQSGIFNFYLKAEYPVSRKAARLRRHRCFLLIRRPRERG